MNKFKFLLLVCSSLLLIACSTMPKKNPQKSELDVYIFADSNINKNLLNDPSPVKVNLLQLTTEVEFNQMTELSSDGTYKKHLGESVVDDIGMMVRPNEYLDFKYPLNNQADYLGVVVAYRNLDNKWKLSLYKQDKRWYQNGGEYLYLLVGESEVVQLTKQEALEKLLSLQLEKNGKKLDELTEKQKKEMLATLEKVMDKKKAADLKKGIFIQTKSTSSAEVINAK